MPGYPLIRDHAVMPLKTLSHRRKLLILSIAVRSSVGSFQFYSYRIVVAIIAARKLRLPRMPGAIIKTYKLSDRPVALDKQVTRDLQVCDGLK